MVRENYVADTAHINQSFFKNYLILQKTLYDCYPLELAYLYIYLLYTQITENDIS